MYKKNSTALFAVIMVLFLLPFAPSYIESLLNDRGPIPTATAATTQRSVTEVISSGYVGDYGITSLETPRDHRVLGITFQPPTDSQAYQAREINRSNAILNLNPGQAVTVWVDFLNTGQATWYNDNDNFIAINVAEPTGRVSSFQHDFWPQIYRPGKLLQNSVAPGETGRFKFALQAPTQTGIYSEAFNLVAENLTWIDGGYFEILIGVGEAVIRAPEYSAQIVKRSHGNVLELEPDQALTFWVDFKNIGLKNWYNDGNNFVAINVNNPTGRVSSFQHNFWNEYYYRPTRLLQNRIYPGETGRFKFALQAPTIPGYYTEKFSLVAENLTFINGGNITIKFKVGDPPVEPASYSFVNDPDIRVGLYNTTDAVQLTADGPMTITDINSGVVTQYTTNQPATIKYSTNAYWRIVPDSNDTIVEINSFAKRPSWNTSLNDNKFRGKIEIRYSDATDKMWIINELPLESYLLGLGEVSNGQPTEYLKALLTSARSYALWHTVRGGKHPTEYFDLNASTDQIYLGYGFEQRSTDPVAAVQATAGMVVTHPDAITQINTQGIAITAYSSGTDGRTRNWSEVWAGSGYPWLVSVDDPYGIISNWDTLVGNHMVGMSANGARGYAIEENKTFDWILQHYYTGTSVKKIY